MNQTINEHEIVSLFLQLKEILVRTIHAWVALFDENHRDQLPKFKLELILDDDDNMQFYPMLSDVEAAVFHVVDTVANTMQNVPTVQVMKHVSLVLQYVLYALHTRRIDRLHC